MDVIGHENIGTQGTFALDERLAQPMQIALIIFLSEEAWFTIMPALHDMQRNVIEMDTRAAGHGETLTEFVVLRNNSSLAPLE
jgi:hypothetical protein